MAFAREIFQQIKNHIRFQQAEKEKDSHYTILGSTLVRISNHCTHMKVWENYFEKNPKYEGMKIVSIVFEDEGSTFTKQCLQLVNRRDNPIVVGEYVYHSASLSKLEIKSIIKSLQEMDYSNTYKDATKKCLFYPRLSVNPPPPYKVPDKIAQHIGNDLFNKLRNYREWNGITNENKQYKNMNKKNTIRLTESDLKRVISESVKKVLKEEYTTDSNIDDFKSRAYGLSENYIRNMHRLLKENEDILPQGLISETHNVILAVRDFKENFEYEVQSKAYGIPIDKTRVKY